MKGKKDFISVIDKNIEDSIKKGLFDDLPGKGKPLKIEESSNSEYWMANKILKDANYIPDWLELDKKIRKDLEEIQNIINAHTEYLEQQIFEINKTNTDEINDIIRKTRHIHERTKTNYLKTIENINPMIRKLNIIAPLATFQKMIIDEKLWIEKFNQCDKLYLEMCNKVTAIKTEKKIGLFQSIKNILTKNKN